MISDDLRRNSLQNLPSALQLQAAVQHGVAVDRFARKIGAF